MNKKLEKLCKTNNFVELFKLVESKTTKPSLLFKDINLDSNDFEFIKAFVLRSTLLCLNSKVKIPISLLSLSMILGSSFEIKFRTAVSNFVIPRKLIELSSFIQNNFQDPSSLKNIFRFLEKLVEEVADFEEMYSFGYDLDLEFLTKAIVIIKQTLTEYFFNSEPENNSFSEGLVNCILYEKKLSKFFSLKKCCSSAENTEKSSTSCLTLTTEHLDQVTDKLNIPDETKKDTTLNSNSVILYKSNNSSTDLSKYINCVHKKMISSVFIPYVYIYAEFKLSRAINVTFNQSATEKSVIKIFVEFFKDLEVVSSVLEYFSDKKIFLDLFHLFDKMLMVLLTRLRMEDEPSKMTILLSTIIYIQEVVQEFAYKLTQKFTFEINSEALAASRKIERALASEIERYLFNRFSGDISEFIGIMNSFIGYSANQVSLEVKNYILEIMTSQLFLRISRYKLNQQKAILLMEEINNLENEIINTLSCTPNLKIVKDFLKIFSCPTETPENFLKNFYVISNGKFDLVQILKSLEDQKEALLIFELSKKIQS